MEVLKAQLQEIYLTLESNGIRNVMITKLLSGEIQLCSNFPVSQTQLERIKEVIFRDTTITDGISSSSSVDSQNQIKYPSTPSPSSAIFSSSNIISPCIYSTRPVAQQDTHTKEQRRPHPDIPPYLMESPPTLSDDHSTLLNLNFPNTINTHLRACFREIQQLSCKAVAKDWIKTLEPRKQTKHPYRDGDQAKPHWWPVEIRHIEPDHLLKVERINLLVSIITGCQPGMLSDFKRGTDALKNLDNYQNCILDEIYMVMAKVKSNWTGEIRVSDFEGSISGGYKTSSKAARAQRGRNIDMRFQTSTDSNNKNKRRRVEERGMNTGDGELLEGEVKVSPVSDPSEVVHQNLFQQEVQPYINSHHKESLGPPLLADQNPHLSHQHFHAQYDQRYIALTQGNNILGERTEIASSSLKVGVIDPFLNIMGVGFKNEYDSYRSIFD